MKEKKSFTQRVFERFEAGELIMFAIGLVICLTAGCYVYFLSNNIENLPLDNNYNTGEIVLHFSNGTDTKTTFILNKDEVFEFPFEVSNTKDDALTYSLSLKHVANTLKYEVIRNEMVIKSGELKKGEGDFLISNAFLDGNESHRYIIKITENE